jgi:Tfp pilus assembly protein PilF
MSLPFRKTKSRATARSYFCRLCFSVFSLAVLSSSVAAQSGTVRGKVRIPSGETITGVIVELWRSSGFEGQTVTTRDGDFEFSGLVPASYEIVIKHQGYQNLSERAEFRSPRNSGRVEIVTLDVTLTPRERPLSEKPVASTTFAQEVPAGAKKSYLLAMSRMREGNGIEAVALLREAVSLFPDYFDARLSLAGELARQGKHEDALVELEHARRLNDRSAAVYHLFGLLMENQKKFVVAEYAFRQAIERGPRNAPSYFSHALALVELAKIDKDNAERMKNLDLAERDLTRALELTNQKMPLAFLHRAVVLELKGNKKAAVRDLETYLKLNPGDRKEGAIREAIAKLNREVVSGQ